MGVAGTEGGKASEVQEEEQESSIEPKIRQSSRT